MNANILSCNRPNFSAAPARLGLKALALACLRGLHVSNWLVNDPGPLNKHQQLS